MNKKEYGQFFSKNKDYILKNMIVEMPLDTCNNIFVDPFAGEKDLLNWISMSCRRKGMPIEAYDIDPQIDGVESRDSLLCPPDLKGKYIITNPPYLAKNKTKNKDLFFAYDTNDLYKASLKMIMGYDIFAKSYCRDGCEGGIIIVPLNFFSDRDWKLRRDFLEKYKVISLNIFEERVFKDTSYTVCAFNFKKREKDELQRFRIRIYPDYLTNSQVRTESGGTGYHLRPTLSDNNNYTIGYQFNELIRDKSKKVKVSRLVENVELGDNFISKLYLRSIDTGSMEGRIGLSIKNEPFYGKISTRTSATIVLSEVFSEEEQLIVVKKFNDILEKYRKKYYSLFLTNFRNSTSHYARKRIDFKMAFDLISHISKNYLIDK